MELEAASAEEPTVAIPEAEGVLTLAEDGMLRPGIPQNKVTIIDFNASWCVPCKKFAPAFEEAAQKYSDVNFVSIDIDQLTETAAAFGVEVIPTVVIMDKAGNVVQKYVGTEDLLPAEKFFKIVESNK